MAGNIFVLEHQTSNGDTVETVVRSLGFEPLVFHTLADFLPHSDGHSKEGCLIADTDDPSQSGIEFVEAVREKKPCLAIILVSGAADTERTVRAMRLGAFSVVEKPLNSKQLGDEILLALQQSSIRRATRDRMAEIRHRLAQLTSDETRILQMLMDGKPNKAMANQLGMSTRTIENRRRQLYDKMGTYCVPELVRMVVELNIRECDSKV